MKFVYLLGIVFFVVSCGSSGEPIATTSTATTEPSVTSTPSAVTTATSGQSTTGQSTTTAAPLPALQALTYTEIAAGLPFPTMISARPADGALFFITKDGQVWEFAEAAPEPVMDISNLVVNRGEQGLLGMAWHPTDASRLFLHYSDVNGDTTIVEYTDLDTAQSRMLLSVDQPAANHNGGTIEFGPDGFLWIALGDGGGAGDTFQTGQTTDDLLAGLLRIDVDGDPYGVPADNPYVNGGGAPEVWATGLRNPWRVSFDEGLVYIGDVGQGAYEEINIASASEPALNYGWNLTEGLHCYDPPQGCDTAGLTLPVVEVAHSDSGTCSITGGVVYRGTAIPELDGHYFYSDYCGGWLRSFLFDGAGATNSQDWTEQVGNPGGVASFGADAAGEIYVLTNERILRIDPVR